MFSLKTAYRSMNARYLEESNDDPNGDYGIMWETSPAEKDEKRQVQETDESSKNDDSEKI